MLRLNVVKRNGEAIALTEAEGLSVMEILRDAGVDEILALCGGCCSCATCHVHIDPAFAAKLPAVCEDENDLLQAAGDRDPGSRLSCQIPFTSALNGQRVRIAQES